MTILDHDGRSNGSGGPETETSSGAGGAPARVNRRRLEPEAGQELLLVVRRARAGDVAAQSELVRKYQGRVGSFIRSMVRQSAAIEDLVQMVMIKMVRQLAQLREPERFETWLFTLARNVVLDHLRRLRCRPVATCDEGALGSLPDASAEGRCHEILEALEVAMQDCGPRERRLLNHVLAGASYRTIAAHEKLSLGALKVRLHRLRLHLRVRVREAAGEWSETASSAWRRS